MDTYLLRLSSFAAVTLLGDSNCVLAADDSWRVACCCRSVRTHKERRQYTNAQQRRFSEPSPGLRSCVFTPTRTRCEFDQLAPHKMMFLAQPALASPRRHRHCRRWGSHRSPGTFLLLHLGRLLWLLLLLLPPPPSVSPLLMTTPVGRAVPYRCKLARRSCRCAVAL